MITLAISPGEGIPALNLILIYEWGSLNKIINYCLEKSHSWDSDDPATTQNIVCLIGYLKVHYRFYNSHTFKEPYPVRAAFL
jgi:hypothetical protein